MKTNFQYYLLILFIISNHFNLHPAARITTIEDNNSYHLGCKLIKAAKNGNNNEIEKLIKQGAHIDFQAQGSDDGTALMSATSKGHIKTVGLLIKLGANVNAINNYDSGYTAQESYSGAEGPNELHTALMIAAYYGYKDIVELLILNKADVNIKDKSSETALIHAVHCKNKKLSFEIAKLLIDAGAEVSVQNCYGDNALWRIVGFLKEHDPGYVNFDLIKLLVYAGIDLESDGADGTPLEHAIHGNREDIVRLLLTYGADEFDSSYMLDIAHCNGGEIIKMLEVESERRRSEIDKWKTLMINKITRATGSQLVNNIPKIVVEYTIDTYKDVVKLEKEDEINKWQTLIANNVTKATGNQLPKDISKVVSDYILVSNPDVAELEKIENEQIVKFTY